jgi:hypothetical protein
MRSVSDRVSHEMSVAQNGKLMRAALNGGPSELNFHRKIMVFVPTRIIDA